MSTPILADEPIRVSALATLVRAGNPGPMTLDGTNSYLLSTTDGGPAIAVDPGPLLEPHVEVLSSYQVKLVLLTHRHPDHSTAATAVAQRTAAPVRAMDPALCIGGNPLRNGETLEVGGVRIEVVATPGHTSDSVCFLLPDDDAGRGSVLTGDTVLGRGTTVIDHPDGRLGDYLASLRRLGSLGGRTVLPGHGPMLPDLAAAAAGYLAHREERLDQIRAALQALGPHADPDQIVGYVYADVPPDVRAAARVSVLAQLAYLAGN